MPFGMGSSDPWAS